MRLISFAAVLMTAIVLVPSSARAQMPTTALAVEARFGAGVTVNGIGTVVTVPTLTVGARLIDRLQIGIGFGLFRISTPTGPGMVSVNQTNFTIAPTITVDIVKAKDNKVALYGKGALPMGAQILSNTPNLFILGYDIALGARYCPHPNFAAGLEGGVIGVFVDPNGNRGTGVTTVYGALVGTFYWGK